ncbi:MAG: hypothetical protein WBK51_10680 [Polaromonas sp.]
MVKLINLFYLAAMLLGHTALYAQDTGNVLGLPAVPQNVTPAASAAKKPLDAAKASEAEIKSVLSGNLKLASFYPEGQVIVRVTTDRTFIGNAVRAQAVQAARLVQRDARQACGKLCKPAPMPAPTLQSDNTLSFDIVVSGYEGVMSTPDMVNLVSGKRVGPAAKPP